ncbi:MAG: hypothetical protein SOT34_00285 [Candidatus Borkfalkiaceae bacterium]|nr:hypothetical protein [Christensenellaceae bacterium]
MIKLTVDLLGADTPEEELARGAFRGLKKDPGLFLYLCGHAGILRPLAEKEEGIAGRYEIVDCPVAVTNYDDPMEIYTDERASVVRAMRLAKGDGGGVITCGATGAVLVSSIMILGKMKGLRPILAVELKNRFGDPLLLLDCGANIDSRPELYPSFARLGDAYLKSVGIPSPRIALLSNGAEETKGCESVKEAHRLLKSLPYRFIGNVEATDALNGRTDAVVCDGFHGNILLKCIEGTAKAVVSELREKLKGIPGADEAIDEVKKKYDYNTQGGAVLLGVNRLVMKGHGSATGEAVENMILRACALLKANFPACLG